MRMRMLLLGATMLAWGCAEEEGDEWTVNDIGGGLPAGSVEGSDWTMVEAAVTLGGAELDIELYAEDVDECGPAPESEAPTVMFSVPSEVGEYPLDFTLSSGGQAVTIYEPLSNTNIVATAGLINVVAVSETDVTVGFVAWAGPNNTIDGTFTVAPCE